MSSKASTIVFFTCVGLSQALFEELSLDGSDVLVNSNEIGRTFGSFNISALTGGVTINGNDILKVGLILLLFKILYALAFGSSLFGGAADRVYEDVYQNRRDSYNYDDYYYENSFSKRRGDGVHEDFATLMHSLEQAFKKYSVDDIECKMFVACESAHISRQDDNGPLAKIVYDVIDQMVVRKDFSTMKMDPEMEGITESFKFGRDADRFGKEDACAPLRTKCFELQNKKAY